MCISPVISYTEPLPLNQANHEGPFQSNQTLSYATCYSKGEREMLCSACWRISHNESFGPVSHSYGSYSTTTYPTCTKTGVETAYCTYGCGTTTTNTLSAYGHNYQNYTTTKAPTCLNTGIETGTCTRCSDTNDRTLSALGHKWSAWKYDPYYHWKECERSGCDEIDKYGAHVDAEPNGYCDTCSAPLYLPPTPAPTITVKDTGGNVIDSTWINKDLVVYVGGSQIVPGTLGAVGYKYNMNNASYSVYPGSGISYKSINTDTTFFAKAYNTGMESQESAVTSRVLPKIEKTKPTFSISIDNRDYKKSHTATLTFADAGGSALKATDYTVQYTWTSSTATPSSYTNSMSVSVAESNQTTATITKSDGTGLYYDFSTSTDGVSKPRGIYKVHKF